MKKLALAISVALASNAAFAVDDLANFVNENYSDNQAVATTSNTSFSQVAIDQVGNDQAVVTLANGALQQVKIDQQGDNKARVNIGGAYSVGNNVDILQLSNNVPDFSRDNNHSVVDLKSSSLNAVSIEQNYSNLADVKARSSNGNIVAIDQNWANRGGPLKSKAKVSLQSGSDVNEITITQKAYALSDVALNGSSGNNITITQNYKSSADVDMTNSSGNILTITQTGAPGWGTGDANLTVKADFGSSSFNIVDVNQMDTDNSVELTLTGSDSNVVDVEQMGDNSMAVVKLENAFGNFVGNQFNATSGISINQSTNDYASVSMTNSDFNAVSINQQ